MSDSTDEALPIQGRVRSVDFAQWSGTDETREAWDQLGYKIQHPFFIKFLAVSDGARLPKEQLRHLEDGIYEFKYKRPPWRVGAFEYRNTWWITHLFLAPHKQKKLRREINIAKRAREEHIERSNANG